MHISTFSHRRFFLAILLSVFGFGGLFFILFSGNDRVISEHTLWIIDNSMSMSVEDVGNIDTKINKSRLDVAKSLVMSGIEALPGDHAILVYASSPGVLVPLTQDKDVLITSTKNIAPVIDNGGSDMVAALSLLASLYSLSDARYHVYILTDGGNTNTGAPLPSLPDMGFTVIGIGTKSGGPIPLGYDTLGKRRYKYFGGKEINVPYEEKNIENLRNVYNAESFQIASSDDIPSLTNSFSGSGSQGTTEKWNQHRLVFLFSLIFLLFGFILHPYVRKKNI